MNLKERITWHIVAVALRPLVAAVLAGLAAIAVDVQLLDGKVAQEVEAVLQSGSSSRTPGSLR